jgi:hypothetical protein
LRRLAAGLSFAGVPRLTLTLAVCCALFAACAASNASAAAPLVADWPLDGATTAGTDTTADNSGNGLALSSAAGTMHFGTAGGKFGGYLSDSNVTPLQVDSPLLATQQVTLLAWIKQNGNPGFLRYIAGRGDDGSTCNGSSYGLYSGYSGNPGLHFYVRQPDPGGTSALSDAPPDSAVFDNQWHLVAGTFDGANVRLYVDGNQIGAAKPASGIGYGAPQIHSNFYVDGYPPAAGCFGNFDFPGLIDEARVYDRALSATELTRLAAAPGPTPPVLEPDAGGPSPQPQVVGPAPKVAVSLTKPATNALKGTTILKLNTSGPVVETKIKLDGKPAFTAPPAASYVGISLNKPGDHTVSATTIGPGGISAIAQAHLSVKPAGPSAIKLTESAISSSTIDLLAATYENNQCVPGSTVTFGVVEATGCFRKLNAEGSLPPLERALAEEYFKLSVVAELGGKEFSGGGPNELAQMKKAVADPARQPFVTDQVLHINGMTVEPLNGASLIVFPMIQRMVSSNVRISYDGSALGSIPVQKNGPLNLDLTSKLRRLSNGDESLSLFEFPTSKAFGDIGGFLINGKVEVFFEKKGDKRSTSLKVNLALPEEITTAAGANPTARIELNADNQRGTYLGLLNIHMGEAFLGPVELANVDFTYNDAGSDDDRCSRKWWKATAEVFFVPVDTGQQGAGLMLAPEPERNGVAFCAGDFHSAGADLKFGYPLLPPPMVFPGVTLNEIGLSFQLQQPVVIDGHVKLKVAEIVDADGGLLMAFASPSHPYTFKPGDAGGTLAAQTGHTYTAPTFAVGGTVSVEPGEGVGLQLGGAHVVYSYPGYVGAGGNAHLNTYLFTIDAGGTFELNVPTGRFNAGVKGEACLLAGIKIAHVGACAGGEGHVSSRGVSVCFDLIDGTWTPGAGYLYGGAIEFFAGAAGDGCKPSHFWEVNVLGARVSAAPNAPLTFRVKPGEEAKTVELTGAGGAPAVTVIGPDGEQLASEANTMLHGKKLSAISAERFNRTWVGVDEPKPGVYKVIPAAGSAAIVGVRETRKEADTDVKASVTGKGRKLVLHYDAGRAAGRRVSFFERGRDTWTLLKTVSGGKGKVAFEPSFGSASRRRTIAAQIEVDGIPAPLQTLDKFKAPPPPKMSRVRNVRVIRHGGKLAVSWRKDPNAQGYSVVTEVAGGAVRSQRVKAKRGAAVVKKVAASEAGRVEVVAFGPTGERGKPGRASFKALTKKETRKLSFKGLGSGQTGKPAKQHGSKKKHGHKAS